MKLYTGDLSPYSAKIRMQIYAMGIEDDIGFDLPVQFMMGKMSEVSPIGRIPVLETDHGLVPESEVIAEYLDELYPQKALLGNTLKERAEARVISKIADTYLMNNIFLSLSQANPANRVQAVLDLLLGQVKRGIGALEHHIGTGNFAVGKALTRADCTLTPALWMCNSTVPRLGVDNPIRPGTRVADYWQKIQDNDHAKRILQEMDRGLQARMDGTERRLAKEAIARATEADSN